MPKRKSGVPRTCDQCGVPFLGHHHKKFCYDCVPEREPGNNNSRWYQILRLYGVDKTMWDAMYFEQDGACAICKKREAVVVDHCHDSGKVRGLLCLGCNTALGYLETPGWMESADDYMGQAAMAGGEWWSG